MGAATATSKLWLPIFSSAPRYLASLALESIVRSACSTQHIWQYAADLALAAGIPKRTAAVLAVISVTNKPACLSGSEVQTRDGL